MYYRRITKPSNFAHMQPVANFYANPFVRMHNTGQVQKLQEQNEMLQINMIQDPVEKAAALKKFNDKKNNYFNQVGQRAKMAFGIY